MKIKYSSFLLCLSISTFAMDKLSTVAVIQPPTPRNTIRVGMSLTVLSYVHNSSALVTATHNNAVVVCDPTPVSVIWMKEDTDIYALDTNPKNNNLIAFQGTSKNISVCDIETSQPVEQLENASGSYMIKHNNEGNQLLITTRENSGKLMDTRSRNTTDMLPDTKIYGAFYNPADDNTIALMNDDAVQLYDCKAGKTAVTIPFIASLINVAFNKEGTKIIAGSTNQLAVLDAITGTTLAQYPIQGKIGDQQIPNSKLRLANASFFPNQSKFLASHWNGYMTLADANDPKFLKTFEIQYETKYCQFFPVTISPDGNDMPVIQPKSDAIYVYDVSAYKQ